MTDIAYDEGADSLAKLLIRNNNYQFTEHVMNQLFDSKTVGAAMAPYSEMVPMFTYGILKYVENIEAEGGVNIIPNAYVKSQIMYATGGRGFPVTKLTENESDKVYGTYFEIPLHIVVNSYDYTEGYNPDASPEYNMYNRMMIDVYLPDGTVKQANQYIANADWFVDSMVPEFQIMTGNYDDKETHLRQILDEKIK
jgi:hypothetical protein